MGAMDTTELLKFVLEPDRLAVLGSLAVRPATVDELVATTGQRRRAVVESVAVLVRGGIATDDGGRYHLCRERLRELARDLPQPAPPAREVMLGMTNDEQAVLARFFRGKRLLEIPATRSKRLVVLERLALEFEPGRRYPEKEVNGILALWHPDYAALRRHLVDEQLLDRAEGEYWRSGGRVE